MTAKEALARRVAGSRFFKNAGLRASHLIHHPEQMEQFIKEADQKAKTKGKSLVGEAREFLLMAFRLLRAYASGRYRQIPWKSLVAAAGAVVYFVMPLDVIPDILLGLGFLDDAALIAWTLKSIRGDMDRFAAWEAENGREQIPAEISGHPGAGPGGAARGDA